MAHSLQRQIDAIARRARHLLILHGLCWFIVVVFSAAFVCGWLDYAFQLQDRGVRIILSVMFVLTMIWSWWRFVVPSFRRRFSDLEVAQRVEQRFPQLGDRLSSSLAFLSGDKAASQTESTGLQRSVISQTEALVRPLRLDECLDPQATRHAILVCIPLLLAIGCICAFDVESTSLALRRLTSPWSGELWPRWNSLEIANAPQQIAFGQNFSLEVKDKRNRLPESATLHLWFDGDAEGEEEMVSMRRADRRFQHTRDNITRAFKYRVTGGDDQSMPWRSLDVVEPAKITDYRIAVTPPAYCGIVNSDIAADAIRVLQGSQLTISGQTDRPMQSVRVHVSIGDKVEAFDAVISSADGRFEISSLPANTVGKGHYWVELVEANGLVSESDTRSSWEVILDHAPLISVAAPTSDMYFTPDATMPIRVTGTDDLAIQSVSLRIGKTTIPLFVGPPVSPTRDGIPAQADVREITRELKLSEFQLTPNDTLQLEFVANDYKPQTSEPVMRSITIISREDFNYRSQEKQKLLLARLVEALRIQRATRAQLELLRTQLKATSELSEEDTNRLRASELQQQQVARLLDDSPGGAARLVSELISSMSNNQMIGSDTAALMERLSAIISTINRERLPKLQSEFVRATKTALADRQDTGSIEPLLSLVAEQQDVIAVELQAMVDQLSQWDDYRRFARDVAKLLRDQQELSGRVNELPTAGQRLDTLSPQQRADLARAASEQLELAQRLDRLQVEMDRLRELLSQSDPAAAATLTEAIREANANGIAEQMREIGSDVAQNRLGNASQNQSQVEQGLQQVLGALTDSSSRDAEPDGNPSLKQLAAGLAQLKPHLAEIATGQQTLLDATRRLRESGNSSLSTEEMATEQQALRDRTKAAREQLPIPKVFSLGMKTVESKMGEAATRMEQDIPVEEVIRLQSQSLSRLKQLLAALEPKAAAHDDNKPPSANSANKNNEQAAGDAGEQGPSLSLQELRLLHAMQVDLHEQTVEVEKRRKPDGLLNSEDQQVTTRLASEQGELAELLTEALSPDEGRQSPAKPSSPNQLDDDLDRALERAGIPGFGVDE